MRTQISTGQQPRAAIIHGYDANPDKHWFSWLATQLETAGYPTTIPAMPDLKPAQADTWQKEAGLAIGIPDQHTIVVAHSLGCLATLRYLSSLPDQWELGALVLVAGFVEPLPKLPELAEFIGHQPQAGCDLATITKRVGKTLVLRSDFDPIVPVQLTSKLAELLEAEEIVVPGAGHFLDREGVTTLPQALQVLEHMPARN